MWGVRKREKLERKPGFLTGVIGRTVGNPGGGTWFNAEWAKLEVFVGHLEVLLGGWSLRPCLGLSRE